MPCRRFSHVAETRADPDCVWAVLSAVDEWPEWDLVREAELKSEFAEGARGYVAFGPGIRRPIVITRVEPGRAYEARMGLLFGSLDVLRTIEPQAGGVVRITQQISFTGLLARLYAGLMGPPLREAQPRVMHRIKSRCTAASIAHEARSKAGGVELRPSGGAADMRDARRTDHPDRKGTSNTGS